MKKVETNISGVNRSRANVINSPSQQKEKKQTSIFNKTNKDVVVNIPDKVKEFAKIKSVVDQTKNIDRREKIALLKKSVEMGDYNINFEELADKMLSQEF